MSTRIAKAFSAPLTPMGDQWWAEQNEKVWDVVKRLEEQIKRLRDENDRLKLALMLHANDRFEN